MLILLSKWKNRHNSQIKG